jgi:hypothetical protein
MAFYNKGYPVVADDYIVIDFDNNDIPIISPGFPSLRLSSKSREVMGLNLDKSIKTNIIDKTYTSVQKDFLAMKYL